VRKATPCSLLPLRCASSSAKSEKFPGGERLPQHGEPRNRGEMSAVLRNSARRGVEMPHCCACAWGRNVWQTAQPAGRAPPRAAARGERAVSCRAQGHTRVARGPRCSPRSERTNAGTPDGSARSTHRRRRAPQSRPDDQRTRFAGAEGRRGGPSQQL
jgi:hypothetical protein